MASADPVHRYVRNADLIATDMDGDTVMMSVEQGDYYGLGGVGSRVWQLLEQPVTLAEIAQTIQREYEVDEVTCLKDMERFLGELQTLGLIHRLSSAA